MSSSFFLTIKTNFKGDNRRFRAAHFATLQYLQEQARTQYAITHRANVQLSVTSTTARLPGTVTTVTTPIHDEKTWTSVKQRAIVDAVGNADPVIKITVADDADDADDADEADDVPAASSTPDARSALLAAIQEAGAGSTFDRSRAAAACRTYSARCYPAKPVPANNCRERLLTAIKTHPALTATWRNGSQPPPPPLQTKVPSKYASMLKAQVPYQMQLDGVPPCDLPASQTPDAALRRRLHKQIKQAPAVDAHQSLLAEIHSRNGVECKNERSRGKCLVSDCGLVWGPRKSAASSSERIAAEAGVKYADVTYIVNPFKKGTAKASGKGPQPSSSERIAAEAGVKYADVTYIVNPLKKGAGKLATTAATSGDGTGALPFATRRRIVEMVARELGVECSILAR